MKISRVCDVISYQADRLFGVAKLHFLVAGVGKIMLIRRIINGVCLSLSLCYYNSHRLGHLYKYFLKI